MKLTRLLAFLLISCLFVFRTPGSMAGTTNTAQLRLGKPASVMLTAYSTTLLANGRDKTRLRIAITDSNMHEIPSAKDSVTVFLTGDAKLKAADGSTLVMDTDTSGRQYAVCGLEKGICQLIFIAGTKPGKVKIEARSGKLWPGSHEIHTLPSGFSMKKPTEDQILPATKPVGRMIGADISFLPQIEDQGGKFSDSSREKDAINLLRDHGFNYIRLRVFVNPENKDGYSPGKGYCGLKYTLEMAKRIKEAGMKLLLDFHYSDYWADPQQQYKPKAWASLDVKTLNDSVKAYTTRVLLALKKQGTMPSMVQVGNEINHGILWPEGHIGNPDQLADLLKSGIAGVEAVAPSMPVMLHLALGGQNQEAVFWLDNMIARGVKFDIIGLSYYPRWHGTLADLKNNLADLLKRYRKPLNVVEYSDFKREVHDIIFGLPDGMGKGACIWEPLGWNSGLFDKNGSTTKLIKVYDQLNVKYLRP